MEEVDPLWSAKVANISHSGTEKRFSGRRRWDQHDTR